MKNQAEKKMTTSLTSQPKDITKIKEQLEECLKLNIDYSRVVLDTISKHNDQQKRKPWQFLLKRIIEVIGTCIGIVILLPILIAISVAIKIESKGPVLFKQKRVGRYGKEFYMYKFRSMYEDAESRLEELRKHNETNEYMFKIFDDPRITKVGKVIRKYSLDELPQLINVLRGEMSLVGFRPPLPSEVDKYKDWHYLRFSGIPGLTGPWQVSGRSNIKNFDIVVELEYSYNKNWNIFKDFVILFKTIPIVLLGKDAA